jgi:hypothetical protein
MGYDERFSNEMYCPKLCEDKTYFEHNVGIGFKCPKCRGEMITIK